MNDRCPSNIICAEVVIQDGIIAVPRQTQETERLANLDPLFSSSVESRHLGHAVAASGWRLVEECRVSWCLINFQPLGDDFIILS